MNTYTVYKITCLANKKLYIGYTKNKINYRLAQHFKAAFKNTKTSNKFHNAIKKYGKINFVIETLETFSDKNEALLCEINTIKFLNSINDGYNTLTGGDCGPETFGPLSTEHKQKISEALKGRIFTNEHKKNISKNHHDVKGENNPFYGKKHTDEAKEKISKNHHDINGKNNPMYGKKPPCSFKSGSEHPRSQPITINGILYESLSIASKALNLHITTIKKRYL